MPDWYQELLEVRQYAETCNSGVPPNKKTGVRQFRRGPRNCRRGASLKISPRESCFELIPLKKRSEYPPKLYATLRVMMATYDLLGLVHLVPVPADHLMRPPSYTKHVPYLPSPVRIIEFN